MLCWVLGIAPNVHVILKTQMKLADRVGYQTSIFACFDLLCNESRDLLNDINQGHGRSPVFLLFRYDVQEKISTVC